MLRVTDSVIADCCNGMLDCNTMEEMLDTWERRIVEQFGESLDRQDTRQRIKERIEKYKKYNPLEGKQ